MKTLLNRYTITSVLLSPGTSAFGVRFFAVFFRSFPRELFPQNDNYVSRRSRSRRCQFAAALIRLNLPRVRATGAPVASAVDRGGRRRADRDAGAVDVPQLLGFVDRLEFQHGARGDRVPKQSGATLQLAQRKGNVERARGHSDAVESVSKTRSRCQVDWGDISFHFTSLLA